MKFALPKNKNSNHEENNLRDFFGAIYSTSSEEWSKRGKKNLLRVFKAAYTNVPAYQQFIKSNKIRAEEISSLSAFEGVPPVTKKNYLRAYAWEDLCKTKALQSQPLVMTSTSGSTGEPFYFPRTSTIDLQSSIYHQMFLLSSKIAKNKSTLIINCFGMGVWIGGLITYQAFKSIAERGYAFTIITPGINKREIFQALRNLGPKYDQIILCGYPPFMKDVIDQAKDNGVEWSDFNLRIIFAAESFSETFRDYVIRHTGIKDIYRDTMNIYGSADLGTMAQETPLCILLRRLALDNKKLYMRLFGQSARLPTLAQFIPEFVTFEEKNGSVYCTGDNVLPLVRYEIGDNGAVLTYRDVEVMCREEGVDLQKEIDKVGIKDTITELPFVYVYERSDFAASFYGAIIYPEFIKKGLLSIDLKNLVTGKFTMFTKNDGDENQFLEINIELKANQKISNTTEMKVLECVHNSLLTHSAEYTKLSQHLGDRIYPKLLFWEHEHKQYFGIEGKQKWVKMQN